MKNINLEQAEKLQQEFKRIMIPFVGSDVVCILRGESIIFSIVSEDEYYRHDLKLYYDMPFGSDKTRKLELNWFSKTASITDKPLMDYLKLIGDVAKALENKEFTEYVIEAMNKFYDLFND